MFTTKKMEELISLILIIGTLISAAIVMLGGAWYLLQNGNENMRAEFLQMNAYHISIRQAYLIMTSFSPIGLIELGLLALVATQILRVGLLAWFYVYIRDYWFTAMSLFILLILLYSFVLRN